MKVHILNNNIVRKRGLLAEHGLSLLIEFNGKFILFDTGQTDVYVHNAKSMGHDLKQVENIILSHGHYDHCGGLEFFPFNNSPKIYINNSAFFKKIGINSDGVTFRDIGIPWNINKETFNNSNFVFTKSYEQIDSGVYLLSGIQNYPSMDKLSENIIVERDGIKKIDKMEDEQLLVIKDENGINIFVGCSHPGIISCIKHVVDFFPNEKITTLIGGMHLERENESELLKKMQKLESFGIKKIIPLHCTGIKAIVQIKKFFSDRCEIAYTGDTLEI